jgi:hypothetical protein
LSIRKKPGLTPEENRLRRERAKQAKKTRKAKRPPRQTRARGLGLIGMSMAEEFVPNSTLIRKADYKGTK